MIVKPTEVRDQAFGVDSDTSKDNGIAEYGSYDYKARIVKVAVYATDGSDEHSKVNTDIAKLLGIPCKQEDGYYPIGVIEIPKSLVTGQTPYINTEEDWEAVKAAIEKIDTSWLTNNTRENIDNVAGSKNKENTISKNLDKVQVDLKHEAGSHKTALFTWNGDSQNIKGNYDYHLDLRFATVTLKFVGVIKGAPQNIDMGNRIYLTNTEILEPGTSDDFYLTGIPNGYQINGYYSDEDLDTVYTFDNKKATADDTIYVELVQKPVKITYNLNGGNLDGETESVVYNNLHVGDTMLTPNDPECEGYTFKGWKDNDGKSPSQQVTGDATYFAQWEKIPDPEPVQSTDVYVYFRVVNTNDENVSIDGLSVKYNANAGGNTWCTFGKISTTKELTLDNVKTDAITQLRSENAQIHTDNAGIKDKVLSNVTWYQLGTWAGAPGYYDSGTYWHLDGKITGYKVTYATGAGEDTVTGMPYDTKSYTDGMYYLSGSEYTVSSNVPQRTGYTFAGWQSSADNTVYKTGSDMQFTMPAKDVTLTAQWTPNNDTQYKVEHYQQQLDGSYPTEANETEPKSGTTGENTAATAKSYTGFTAQSFAQKTIAADGSTVVEIKYERNKHNIIYQITGENFAQNSYKTVENVLFGSTLSCISDDMTKDGYTFSEWEGLPATMPDNDVTVTGSYTKNKVEPDSLTYTINQHFMNAKGNKQTNLAHSDKDQSANKDTALSDLIKDLAKDQPIGKDKYMYVSGKYTTKSESQKDQPIESGSKLTEDTTIDLYYYLDNWKDGDEAGKDSENGGDNIPDCYQVLVKYQSSDTNRGSVGSLTMEVLTIKNKENVSVGEGQVTASGSTAIVTGNRCYFVNWTKKQEGTTDVSTVTSSANLTAQTFDAKGGDVYTFTANFDRSSGGGSGGSNRPKPPVVEIPDDVPTGLNGKDHYAYIIGYGNNDVRPQNNITRAEVATIFFRLLTDETREANMTKSNGYNDVKDGDWFCCAVSTLSKMGIIKGYEDGSFKPNDPISRAEFAAIAARFDPDGDKTPATFADVTSHWAKDEISIAANHGWIKGYEDGSFKPDQKITRAETMTLVNRVLNRLPEAKDDLHKDMKTWVDNMDETAWYYLAVQEATNSHYFKNKTGTKFEQWTDLRDTRDWSELEK